MLLLLLLLLSLLSSPLLLLLLLLLFCVYSKLEHHLFIDFKKAYDSVRREVLYKILIDFGISKKKANKNVSK